MATTLQILNKQTIEKFYRDVAALDLKFPIAAISKATKESKGNVSKYLSRKLEPSESFLKRFYNNFENSSKIVSHETSESHSHLAEQVQITMTRGELESLKLSLSVLSRVFLHAEDLNKSSSATVEHLPLLLEDNKTSHSKAQKKGKRKGIAS